MHGMNVTRAAFVILGVSLLAACSNGPTPEQRAAAHKAAMAAQAGQDKATFDKMVAMKSYQLALPLGEEIVSRYPGTPAAKAIQAQMPELRSKAATRANTLRLERLWVYQVAPMAGGTQSTAAINATSPPDAGVRLVLRRHTAWGLSVFLYADGTPGFDCRGTCTVPATFDGHPVDLKAYVPKGGRPALMFRHEKAFVAKLEKASVLHLKVRMKAMGLRDLEFEVAGFDPAKWKKLKQK